MATDEEIAELRQEVATLKRDANKQDRAIQWLLLGVLVLGLVFYFRHDWSDIPADAPAVPAYQAPALQQPNVLDQQRQQRDIQRLQQQTCDAQRRAYDAQLQAYQSAQARGEFVTRPAPVYC